MVFSHERYLMLSNQVHQSIFGKSQDNLDNRWFAPHLGTADAISVRFSYHPQPHRSELPVAEVVKPGEFLKTI